MPRAYGQLCPMARSLEIIGERWTLLIVRDLLRGPRRFQDLAESLGTPAPGILSRRLKLLERQHIVSKRLYSEHPPRAEYALTPQGRGLRDVVRALTIWGSKHFKSERVLVHERCKHPIEVAYRCAHCNQLLDSGEIAFHTENTPRGAPHGRIAPPSAAADRARPPRRQRHSREPSSLISPDSDS